MEIPGLFCLFLKAEDWPLVFERAGPLWLPLKSVSQFMRMIRQAQSLILYSIFYYVISFVLFVIAYDVKSVKIK